MIQDIWFCFWGPEFGAATAIVALYVLVGGLVAYGIRRSSE